MDIVWPADPTTAAPRKKPCALLGPLQPSFTISEPCSCKAQGPPATSDSGSRDLWLIMQQAAHVLLLRWQRKEKSFPVEIDFQLKILFLATAGQAQSCKQHVTAPCHCLCNDQARALLIRQQFWQASETHRNDFKDMSCGHTLASGG